MYLYVVDYKSYGEKDLVACILVKWTQESPNLWRGDAMFLATCGDNYSDSSGALAPVFGTTKLEALAQLMDGFV